MSAAPFTLSCIPTFTAVTAGRELTLHALVRIRAASTRAGDRPRLAAALALDVSGSMGGQPLEHVVRSTERIASLLTDRDELCVVAFSTAASTVSPLRRLDAAGKRALEREVRSLRASGGTNISAGLAHAALMLPARAPGTQQLVLLLSDGQPNHGTASPEGLAAEASRIRERGPSLGSLGYGSHHDERVLQAIANAGGGRYAFVSEPQLAEGAFVQALGAQLDVVLEGPRLVLTPSEDADIVRVLGGARTSFGADGLRVHLQDLVAGDERNIVVEMRLRAWRDGDWSLLHAAVTGRTPSGVEASQRQVARVHVGAQLDTPDLEAQAATSIALAAEARDRSRALADRGDFEAACRELSAALALLERTPGFARASGNPLDDAFDAITDDITVLEQRPDQARYAHYRKAQQDYLGFAQDGATSPSKLRRGAMSPSAQEMSVMRAAHGAPAARLVVLAGAARGQTFAIDRERVIIGRGSAACDLVLSDHNVSRQHALIERLDGGDWLIDMGSTNGVLVRGAHISRHLLRDGDELTIGDHVFRYEQGR